MRRPLLLLASLSLLTACAPQSLQDLGHHFTVGGVVTDATTVPTSANNGSGNGAPPSSTGNLLGTPLAGVTVTLVSSDHFAPIVTGADGQYVFSNVLQGDGLVLLFEKTGYAPETKSLGDLISQDGGVSTSACGCTITPDGLGYNQAMLLVSATGATVTGRIIASAGTTSKPISGATVTLISEDNLAPVTTDANGLFTFTAVKQLSNLRLVVTAKGFITYNGAAFNIGAASFGYLPSGAVASPFYDSGDLAPTPLYALTGIVTDAATLLPLAGVTVTLNTPDDLAPVVTDAHGNYLFYVDPETVSNSTTAWSITYALPGYATDVQTFAFSTTGNASNGSVAVCETITLPSGISQPTCVDNHQMTRAGAVLAGTVRYLGVPAVGAVVELCAGTVTGGTCAVGTTSVGGATIPAFAAQQTVGANGQFNFNSLVAAGVAGGNYTFVVLPYDANGDGISDTQLFVSPCNPGAEGTNVCNVNADGHTDLTDLAINLSSPGKNIVASSFTGGDNLPWWTANAGTPNAVTGGFLPSPSQPIFLQFGAPVDPSVTTFELHQYSSNGVTTVSGPLSITTTWSGGALPADAGTNTAPVIATITPAAPLTGFDNNTAVTYKIWVTSLRWADGSVTVPQHTADNPADDISFSVYTLEPLLTNPTPAVYAGDVSVLSGPNGGTVRQAASEVFDFGSIFWLDKNNDIVKSTTTFDLTWPVVPGAVNYTLLLRNTINIAQPQGIPPPAGSSDWTQYTTSPLTTTGTVDPVGNSMVIATGIDPTNVFTYGIGGPWAFGNNVQLAIVCTDQNGNTSPVDPTKLLATGDKWGGLVANSVSADGDGTAAGICTTNNQLCNGQFAQVQEGGDLFTKTLAFNFTEAMQTSPLPTLTLTSGALSLVGTNPPTAYGDATGPVGSLPDEATFAWFNLQFQATQFPCTEVLAGLTNGDVLIPVRDSSLFTTPGSKLVVLNPTGGMGTGTVTTAGTDFLSAVEATVGNGTPVANLVQVAALAPLPPYVQPAAGPPIVVAPTINVTAPAIACVVPTSSTPFHGATQVSASGNPGFCTTAFPGGVNPNTTNPCNPNIIPVSSAAGFYVGETVVYYEPASGTAFNNLSPIADVVTVLGVDTVDNRIVVNGTPTIGNTTSTPETPGHTAMSVVIPLAAVGADATHQKEVTLRPALDLSASVTLDVAAPATVLSFSQPGGAFPVMVGDLLLIDNDGDTTTTLDQNTVPVTAVHCEPTEGTAGSSPAQLFAQQCTVTFGAATQTTSTPTAGPGVFVVAKRSKVIALGDSFRVAGEKDTSGITPLNTHGDQFSLGYAAASGNTNQSY